MTDAKFRAPDDGGGTEALGAGMQRLGRSASSFAEAWSERDAMRDEAKTRKADNALVESWQTLSEPYFGASGEAAVKAGPAARRSLDEEIGRQRGTLDNDRQRGMFDQVAKLRRDEWLSRIAQHEEGAVADFDETESQRRQELAVGSMAAAAGKDYGPGVVANEQVLLGEVDGRSRRRGLDEAGMHQARLQALAAARAQVVEQLANVDPGKAQAWLDTHRADIGDPATLERLDRMLRPFVEEQQAERIADEIRASTSGLDAQIAGADGRELSPDLAVAVKESLQRRTRADDAATADAQKQAADKAWSIALDPAATSLRSIPPMLYATLAPGEQDAIRQAIAANARMEDPAPDPALYLALSDKAAHGVLTIDDVRHAWGRLPLNEWKLIAGWQKDIPEHGMASNDSTLLRRVSFISPQEAKPEAEGVLRGPMAKGASSGDFHFGQSRKIGTPFYSLRPNEAKPNRKNIILNGGGSQRIEVRDNPDADGAAPLYEKRGYSQVDQNEKYIIEMSEKYHVNADLIRSIIFVETTHGYYDMALAPFDANKSILPMNINTRYWGDVWGKREDLKDPRANIEAGTKMLRSIMNAMPKASVAQVATIYNNSNADKVSDYGARVERVYMEKYWEQK
jgi:hypothetical protein